MKFSAEKRSQEELHTNTNSAENQTGLSLEDQLVACAREYSPENIVQLLKTEEINVTNVHTSLPHKLVAVWGSVAFLGIEAQTESLLKDYDEFTKKESEEEIKKRAMRSLVVRGFSAIKKENRAYQEELIKVKFSRDKKDILLDLGAYIERVEIAEPFIENEPLRYQFTLRVINKSGDMFMSAFNMFHKDIEVAFQDAVGAYKKSKILEEERLEEKKDLEPEYYYAKSGVEDTLNRFRLYVSMHENKNGICKVKLQSAYDQYDQLSIDGEGSTYEEAFDAAVGDIDKHIENALKKSNNGFDVTGFDSDDVGDLFELMQQNTKSSSKENKIAFYRKILLKMLNNAIENKILLTSHQEENIKKYQNDALNQEDYEFLTAISKYDEQKKSTTALKNALDTGDLSPFSKEAILHIQKQALKERDYTLAAQIQINLEN